MSLMLVFSASEMWVDNIVVPKADADLTFQPRIVTIRYLKMSYQTPIRYHIKGIRNQDRGAGELEDPDTVGSGLTTYPFYS